MKRGMEEHYMVGQPHPYLSPILLLSLLSLESFLSENDVFVWKSLANIQHSES